MLVQLISTPLLAGWSIRVGIAISSRFADVRVAQELSVFATALLVVDGLGWRAVATMFDRERLVAGRRS